MYPKFISGTPIVRLISLGDDGSKEHSSEIIESNESNEQAVLAKAMFFDTNPLTEL